MREKAEREEYFDAIKADYENMKKKLSHDKKTDLDKARTEITELLELEITKRYYFQKASIESTFDDDTDIKTALDILHNDVTYKSLLKVK